MATLKERIVILLGTSQGLTDSEIRVRLDVKHHAAVNQATNALVVSGRVFRQKRPDGIFVNYLNGMSAPEMIQPLIVYSDLLLLSEDDVKQELEAWLKESGWQTDVKWGHTPGIDIEAYRDGIRWIIEVKGCGSRDAMRHNYFLAMLGELLQRMNDPNARYSIALPDMRQFRRLWQRLPELAKSRTTISALFVDPSGNIEEMK